MSKYVLVAEDDKDIAQMVRHVLQDEGYDVRVTMGSATLDAVRERCRDVLLLDNNMPGMSGIEIARRLHGDPATSGITIITMTAATGVKAICQKMVANGCLGKPFEIDALVTVVEIPTHSAQT